MLACSADIGPQDGDVTGTTTGTGGASPSGGGGEGGAPTTSNDVGAGGAGGMSPEGGAGTGGTGGGPADPCDIDGDGFYADSDGCGNGAPSDCDDTDERVRPDQTDYFDTPYGNGSFDYDCDGVFRPLYATFCSCAVQMALLVTSGARGCGEEGALKECSGLLCTESTVLDPAVRQPCN